MNIITLICAHIHITDFAFIGGDFAIIWTMAADRTISLHVSTNKDMTLIN